MRADLGFLLFLAVTLAFLGGAVSTGRKGLRRSHLALVACSLASLGTTIWFAEQMGREIDIESAGAITPIHLTLAKLAVISYLLPLATGLRTWFHPATRRLHRACAYVALTLTVLAAVTGTAMWLMSEPLELPVPEGATGDAPAN